MGKKRSVAGEAKTSRSHDVGVLKTTKYLNNGLPPRNHQGLSLFFFFVIISFSTLLFNYRMTYLDGLFFCRQREYGFSFVFMNVLCFSVFFSIYFGIREFNFVVDLF